MYEDVAHSKGYSIIEGKPYKNGRSLKTNISTWGYERFGVSVNGVTRGIMIHRLVAYQKYGDDIYEKGIVVRHLDGDKLNNSESNIAIGSQLQNYLDIPYNKREKVRKYASLLNTKYSANDIQEFYKEVKSYKSVMNKFGIKSKGTIRHILNKR